MLSDKQSLYLCGIVAVGFVAAGIFNVLTSYITMGILGLLFLIIVVNIFVVNPFEKEKEESEENQNNNP